MATFFIEQFGCRATQADAAAIERQLVERGYAASADANSADFIVVNTCTVTAAADLQARQSIRTIHRENPAARVIVTGCYAQRAPEELAALEGVSWVVGNSHKPEIPRIIQEIGQEIGQGMAPVSSGAARQGFVPLSMIASKAHSLERGPAKILTGDILEQRDLLVAPVEGGEAGHTRPVLKIQDGCNKRCSYCVIPQVRGRSRSLAPQSAIEEIRKLCRRGAREVVLDLNVGKVPVHFEESPGKPVFGEMTQANPEFGALHDREAVVRACGLRDGDIDPSLPVQTVSTGVPFTVVPLRGLELMRNLHVDLRSASEYLGGSGGKFFYFVTRETVDPSARLHARMMFYNGEDPATGSAAGCTAAWMVAHGVAQSDERVLIEQGVEMKRPSRIFVRASRKDDRVVNVRVGGNVVEILRGEIFF